MGVSGAIKWAPSITEVFVELAPSHLQLAQQQILASQVNPLYTHTPALPRYTTRQYVMISTPYQTRQKQDARGLQEPLIKLTRLQCSRLIYTSYGPMAEPCSLLRKPFSVNATRGFAFGKATEEGGYRGGNTAVL